MFVILRLNIFTFVRWFLKKHLCFIWHFFYDVMLKFNNIFSLIVSLWQIFCFFVALANLKLSFFAMSQPHSHTPHTHPHTNSCVFLLLVSGCSWRTSNQHSARRGPTCWSKISKTLLFIYRGRHFFFFVNKTDWEFKGIIIRLELIMSTEKNKFVN